MSSATPYATAVPVSNEVPNEKRQEKQESFKVPTTPAKQLSEHQIKRLMEQGFPSGLAQSLTLTYDSFPYRIWVVDNSGSMHTADGHRIIDTVSTSDVRTVECTRWEEIRECVNYHIRMAGLMQSPTTFRLLNHPGAHIGEQQFDVAETPESAEQDMRAAISLMSKCKPTGSTPLTAHIQDIHQQVCDMAPELQSSGKRVVIVLATDGLPTDERGIGGQYQEKEFVEALRSLEGLPIWIVIRLCTDEEKVVNFYSDLDDQLELSLDVLDDFCGEAAEVYEHNPWLNYALPLHRCRELGYHDRLFDLIDERPLTKGEVRDFCVLLFGQDKFDGVPDTSDWTGFTDALSKIVRQEKSQWNPMKKKATPWIDMKKLNKKYGRKRWCLIM